MTHNLEKVAALRKSFWHLAIEGLPGDYFEFGVASGNSLSSARLAAKGARARFLGVEPIFRNFYGFDTFDSFQSSDPDDSHHTWTGSRFSFDIASVARRFNRHPEVKLFKLNAEVLGSGTPEADSVDSSVGNSTVAIALFDMDIKGPTVVALDWILPRLQPGALIIFDEFFAFNGSDHLGESGALSELLKGNQGLRLREFHSYGDGGRVFQVAENARFSPNRN